VPDAGLAGIQNKGDAEGTFLNPHWQSITRMNIQLNVIITMETLLILLASGAV
jgi:hypothetical protein